MRRLLLSLSLLAALWPTLASADVTQARIVATCGTPPATLTAGGITELFADTTGKFCDTGSGGGGGGTSSSFGAAFPATGTAIGVKNGANMVNLAADASNNLLVNLATAIPTGANVIGAVTQSAGPWTDNVTQFGGTNISTGTGAGGAGIPRVTVSNDSTVGLVAGSAIIGKVGIDQTTPGTTNGVQVNAALPTGANTIGGVTQATSPWVDNITQFGGVNVSTGTGASGTGIPRVTVSNDSSLAANQSVNVNQFGGSAVNTGTGAGGTGTPRVTISNDAATYLIAGSAVSSLVLKASAGKMYGVSAECTAACWLMVFNATSLPGNGATTAGTASGNLQDCIPINANAAGFISYPNERPENFSVGITAAISSTTCATLTASAVAFVKGFAE